MGRVSFFTCSGRCPQQNCHCEPVLTLAWGRRAVRRQWQMKHGERVAAVKISVALIPLRNLAPQQEIRFWPPCVKGAVSYGGIAAEIGAKNMPPACFLNAPTGGLSVIRQPLRQKSKIFATSPYTGEALVTDSHVASLLGMTLAGVALSLAYPSSSPVISATSGSMKKPSRMPRFSAMSAFFRRVWASSNST